MTAIRRGVAAAAFVTALIVPAAASAHRQWILPSSTVLSKEGSFVTVDAAVSNDLFFFDHVPMRLDAMTITGPDGAKLTPQNAATGKYRSTFDVELAKPGTYRIGTVNDGVFASYKLNGETKRWRGRATELATAVPAGATEVKVTQSTRRVETFVTAGAPSTDALKPSGQGLELQPVTHPNDLVAGESASFKLLLDGKPARDTEVDIVLGGGRYLAKPVEAKVKTNAEGLFSYSWPQPGMYWIEAEARGGASTIPNAERSAAYVATFEVLPE
ncbi:DUF4198 domain-containing protein [Phenylobacterium deserti]|uniref:DUF4198 domain-containing protein n=1 Tax=Phenylobacterium deserti TaxID=1914756 RepID=A0A328AQQ9_9CAUL|nr:DUF4198 domain-containing protein [Phenylobacterium deserti]RAK57350.1 DUF4198 domain-containing protein [Phenylobacterium deserti]